jgi:phosphate transport system permease protein
MAFASPSLLVTSLVKDMKSRYLIDRSSKAVVLICATACFVVLLAIVVFTIREALPAFRQVGLLDFLFGKDWSPSNKEFGILTIIVGSVVVMAGALIIAVPLGIACAILLAEVAPSRVRQFLRPTVELLVGIPSVVYGLVGMVLIVPLIRQIGGSGYSVAAGVIVLTGMVLPTIISISEDSIRAVPKSYKEGALALGATQWQTIWRVLLPAARSGIMASIVLAMGRAIGEAMAMIMVLGNAPVIPTSLLDPARTLAGSIAVEVNYASGVHRSALFATAVVLFLIVIIINSIALIVLRRGSRAQSIG